MYKKLLQLMKSVGVTHLELATHLKITPTTMWYRLNGVREFRLDEAIKIKDYMNYLLKTNYTVEEIFEKEEK